MLQGETQNLNGTEINLALDLCPENYILKCPDLEKDLSDLKRQGQEEKGLTLCQAKKNEVTYITYKLTGLWHDIVESQ